MTQDEKRRLVEEFLGEMIAQGRKLADEGMAAAQAADLVIRQARLAIATGKLR